MQNVSSWYVLETELKRIEIKRYVYAFYYLFMCSELIGDQAKAKSISLDNCSVAFERKTYHSMINVHFFVRE